MYGLIPEFLKKVVKKDTTIVIDNINPQNFINKPNAKKGILKLLEYLNKDNKDTGIVIQNTIILNGADFL